MSILISLIVQPFIIILIKLNYNLINYNIMKQKQNKEDINDVIVFLKWGKQNFK